ncbi:MAG: R3H domain-containing nucleic acid-binding protein [Candidatus Goldiibacteriota bacterium]|jgi:spoIIIJ-associated protein
MNGTRKTAPTVSLAVKEFLDENSITLESLSANLVGEKVFTDKREYTVECFVKNSMPARPPVEISEEDIGYAREIVVKLLSLMRFTGTAITVKNEHGAVILKISTPGKDGLLIGKNGQNIMALQYLLSVALDKNLKRHAPVIIDIDCYRDKRASYLRSLAKTMAEKALSGPSEIITDFLPSYERKLLHEEIKGFDGLKTFSIGKGSYKKVVITSLL